MDVKATTKTRPLKNAWAPPTPQKKKQKKTSLSLHRIELSLVPVISLNPQVENGNDTT